MSGSAYVLLLASAVEDEEGSGHDNGGDEDIAQLSATPLWTSEESLLFCCLLELRWNT